MTLMEAIAAADVLRPNAYSRGQKIRWLSELDGKVHALVLSTHEGGQDAPFEGYRDDCDPERVLLIPPPFDEIYLRHLECQMDYHNGEIQRFNNSSQLFNSLWTAFSNHYNRTHRPKGRKMKYF